MFLRRISMKKLVAILLMLAMALTFVACSNECAECGKEAEYEYNGEDYCATHYAEAMLKDAFGG